jgi:FKBP-type peptidyl-prolyl cis-trans isomerase
MTKYFFILLMASSTFLSCSKDSGPKLPEEEQINNYITEKKLVVTETTSSGLRFILTTANASGAVLKTGQNVTVKYAGKLLSGKQFDAGTFDFVLGSGRVIKGFDEGIAKLKVGEKGTLIFPSTLGYGLQGAGGDIPGSTPLLFDIEVISAK